MLKKSQLNHNVSTDYIYPRPQWVRSTVPQAEVGSVMDIVSDLGDSLDVFLGWVQSEFSSTIGSELLNSMSSELPLSWVKAVCARDSEVE